MGDRKVNFNVDMYETFGELLGNDIFTDDLLCSLTSVAITNLKKSMRSVVINVFIIVFVGINY